MDKCNFKKGGWRGRPSIVGWPRSRSRFDNVLLSRFNSGICNAFRCLCALIQARYMAVDLLTLGAV